MQHSSAPRDEIARAETAVQGMRSAQSLDDFEEHWKSFLHRLERTWSKTKAHYGRSPKFGNWSASTESLRRTDPLLSYMVNARGAEEHTVNEITERELGSVGINLADGVGIQPDGSVRVERLEISSGAGSWRIKSAQPLKVTFTPARTRMSPVLNRGRTYPVPASHAGQPLDSKDLATVAELALKFYVKVVADAEAFFVK